MKSPVRFLMKENLANSIFTIAPERQAEFDHALADFDLVYEDTPEWKFHAKPEEKTIFVSRGAVELIWCASLAHFLFYYHLIQGKKFDKPVEIDPHSHPDVDKALQLLNWALDNYFHPEKAVPWPADLPAPVENPDLESNLAVADELCLITCATMLHHELSHVVHGHIPTKDKNWSLDQEKEADNDAVDWVLGLVSIDSGFFKKRILGVSQAAVLTTALSLYRNNLGGNTHPFTYDRLSSQLNRFLAQDRHTAKDMAFAVLDLHFWNSKRRWNGGPFTDAAEALEALCDRLAAEAHGRVDRAGNKI